MGEGKERRVEPGRTEIDIARSYRHRDRRGGIKAHELGGEAFVAEIALGLGDKDRRARQRGNDSDLDRLQRAGGQDHRHRGADGNEGRQRSTVQRAHPVSSHGVAARLGDELIKGIPSRIEM